jgi:hypothetical protein
MNPLSEAAQQALGFVTSEAWGTTPYMDVRVYEDAARLRDVLQAALAQQAEPVEPVAWKQGNLVTFNEDPYPALGSLFVQFWDGEEVAARVYANDHETLRQRCAKVNAAPPQRKLVPLTEEEIDHAANNILTDDPVQWWRKLARAVEKESWEKNNGKA